MTEIGNRPAVRPVVTACVLLWAVVGCSVLRGGSDPPFRVDIERVRATAAAAAQIERAESLQTRPNLKGRAERMAPETDEVLRWGTTPGASGLRVPETINRHVIEWYVQRIEALRADRVIDGIAFESATLTYRARVEHHASIELDGIRFRDVDVVRMKLTYTETCGNLCGEGFERERLVVFDGTGAPVGSFMTGAMGTWVS